MELKIVKVTDKGQISLPVKVRESMNIDNGDELIVMTNDNSIVLKKLKKSDFRDLLKHSEKTANKLWNNGEDEVWNDV